MGYRSQVVLAIKKEIYNKNAHILRENLRDCDSISQTEDAFYFSWEDVKWYSDMV